MGIRKREASYGSGRWLSTLAVLTAGVALAAAPPLVAPPNFAGLYRVAAPARLYPALRREGDSLRVLLNRAALPASSEAAPRVHLTAWASYDAPQPLWQQVQRLRPALGLSEPAGQVLGAAVAAGQLAAGQVLEISLDSVGVQPVAPNPATTAWLPLTAERLSRPFVLLDSAGLLLARPYLRQGAALRVAAYGAAVPVRWRRYPTGAAAAPPFADPRTQAAPRTLGVLDSSAAASSSGPPLTLAAPGLYALKVGAPARTVPLLVVRPDFPGQTTADELIENLLYLTSAAERRRLSESPSPKRAVDDFWLTAAGDDQAIGRDLIRRYYGRVTAANELFTGHKAGWRTDRGLLYVVLGPPQRVSRSATEERWYYAHASRAGGPVEFTFRARPSILAPDNYELVRHPEYEQLWYAAVDQWRKPLSVR